MHENINGRKKSTKAMKTTTKLKKKEKDDDGSGDHDNAPNTHIGKIQISTGNLYRNTEIAIEQSG